MLPGVDTERLPAFQRGTLVSVVVPGNPAPIAVGLALLSSDDMAAAGAGRGKGKAVEVLQAYGDFLWSEAAGKPVANEGFLGHVVAPLPGMWEGGVEEEGEGGEEEREGGEAAAAGGVAAAEPQGAEDKRVDGDSGGAVAGGEGAAAEGAAVAAAGEGDTGAAEDAAAGEGVNMDYLLEAALLQALHKSVKDGELPIAGSVLWWVLLGRCRSAAGSCSVLAAAALRCSTWMAQCRSRSAQVQDAEAHGRCAARLKCARCNLLKHAARFCSPVKHPCNLLPITGTQLWFCSLQFRQMRDMLPWFTL